MNRTLRRLSPGVSIVLTLVLPHAAWTQVSGNVGYGGGHAGGTPQQRQQALQRVAADQLPPQGFTDIDAAVLANVAADGYVATFALAEQGETVAAAGRKMAVTVAGLQAAFAERGVAPESMAIDPIAQTRVYEFTIDADVATESLAGFELKKNLLVRYERPGLLDDLLPAAAELGVFDLVKVDYVVRDVAAVHARLMATAAEVLAAKRSRYEDLLGTQLASGPQILAERTAAYFPPEMYQAYTAAESGSVEQSSRRNGLITKRVRRSTTFHYDGLAADGFDRVLDPVVLAPKVQFTLYLKVRHRMVPVPAARPLPEATSDP